MNKNERAAINNIRILSAEMVEKAKSGHPGLPLGAAPAAYTLWKEVLRHTPKDPNWPNRDRFVLSAGHGSSLLYSLLHCFGYGLTMEDLKSFRQLGSLTPGHPEKGHTVGVEVTTGPLGQGIAMAVGMAIAEKHLAAKFNKPGNELIDHYTYALCGDGCLMEGLSYESASLAGTLGLNKLVLLYDSNNITIEGSTSLAFTEDIKQRFESMNWDYFLVNDGNDTEDILAKIKLAKASPKPAVIEIKTHIGFGAPNKQGKSSAHGEPLGADELLLLKKAFGMENLPEFSLCGELKAEMEEFAAKAEGYAAEYDKTVKAYKEAYPELYGEWLSYQGGKFAGKLEDVSEFWNITDKLATRAVSGKLLNIAEKHVPNLFGGSADLSPSNNSVMKDREYFSDETPSGSNMHFGVRELCMTAVANGIAAHGGLRPYVAGFFVFADYMKPALRLSALMKLPLISILTHDSIGVGEDGPTHQPIEQLCMLRSIPGLNVIRPADGRECAAAWHTALTSDKPTALILTRQALEAVEGTSREAEKGGYVIAKSDKAQPDMLLIATGSELGLAAKARAELLKSGIDAAVVSLPSMNIFEEQSEDYKQSVIPDSVRKRVVIEAASAFGLDRYAGLDGKIIAMDSFGASAPGGKLFEKYGFTVDYIVETAKNL